jgi:hypothetical protein
MGESVHEERKTIEPAKTQTSKQESRNHSTSPFESGHGKAAVLDGKHVGDGGFGRRLLGASADAADEHAGEWGEIATPVAPALDTLEGGIREQHQFVEEMSTTDWYFTDPGWQAEAKEYAKSWATANMTALMRYEGEQSAACFAYNSWVPLANASHRAMAEVVEAASILGFDPSTTQDAAAFAKALEDALAAADQLVSAQLLGTGKPVSWADRDDDASEHSFARPDLLGVELGPQLLEIQQAYSAVQTAYGEVYAGLLDARQERMNSGAAAASAEIAKIDSTITFWRDMASFCFEGGHYAADLARGRPGEVLDQRHGGNTREGKLAAHEAMNHAYAAERDPSNYGAHLDAHAKAHKYETYHDTWGPGAEKEEHAGGKVGETTGANGGEQGHVLPPLSISEIISTGLEAWFYEKREGLEAKLAGFASEGGAAKAALTYHRAETAKTSLDEALKTLAQKKDALGGHDLAQRQQDYVNMGHELDRYAVEHSSKLRAQGAGALVPRSGHELHATTMAVLAKVEQYRALSTLALGSFDYDSFVARAHSQQFERERVVAPPETAAFRWDKTNRTPPTLPVLSAAEARLYTHIGLGYQRVKRLDTHWGQRLAGVIDRARLLMAKLSGAAGAAQGVGRTF